VELEAKTGKKVVTALNAKSVLDPAELEEPGKKIERDKK